MNSQAKPMKSPPFIVRALWFILVGWELTAIWIVVAWVLNLTIVGLPLGLWMIDRVPQILTLKARSGMWLMNEETGTGHFTKAKQHPFILRAIYFVFIGSWFSLGWATVGWFLCLLILPLPIGIAMLNKLPAVTTLRR